MKMILVDMCRKCPYFRPVHNDSTVDFIGGSCWHPSFVTYSRDLEDKNIIPEWCPLPNVLETKQE